VRGLGVVRDLGLRDQVPFLLADLADLQVLPGEFEAAEASHAGRSAGTGW